MAVSGSITMNKIWLLWAEVYAVTESDQSVQVILYNPDIIQCKPVNLMHSTSDYEYLNWNSKAKFIQIVSSFGAVEYM